MKFLRLTTAVLLLGALTGAAAHAHDSFRQHNAVTLWWIIFNAPEHCVTNPGAFERCGELDIFGQDYLDSVAAGSPNPSLIRPNLDSGLAAVYATGGITSRSGRVRLVASIYRTAAEGLNLAGEQVVDPLGLGRAFSNPGAEVHLVVRDHGRRDRFGKIFQITSFLEPFCSDPALGFEGGENTCQDVQAAVFAPGETGKEALSSLSSGRILSNTSAYLFRQGDMLQAVVETTVRSDRRR